MDIQDRAVETGSRRYEQDQQDYYTSPEVLEELINLEGFVSTLEAELKRIEAGDDSTINEYWEKLEKSPK
ncbi:MAG: hypothetical protein Q8O46_04075 [bacterium]|nr:hypothetical protein [bacterium]